tara:strand:+ start:706 stop:1464 length:759 start_codon:yes stop_codon:yes gene_type:complete
MITLKKVLLFNLIIAILIILYIHSNKYFYISNDQVIEQVEQLNKFNLEESVSSKNPTIVRHFINNIDINSLDIENLEIQNKKVKDLIKSPTLQVLLFNPLQLNNKINIDLYNLFNKNLKLISSPLSLSLFNNNYINFTKNQTKTRILQLFYDRTYIHILSGKVKCYLFHPIQIPNLYLKKQKNRYMSLINTNKPDMEKFPKYKDSEVIEIILRKNTLLYIPNYWCFYIESLEDSVFMFYNSDTVISKIINLF